MTKHALRISMVTLVLLKPASALAQSEPKRFELGAELAVTFACLLIFPPPLSCELGAGRTLPVFDVGGGFELFSTDRTFVRAELGDRVLKYPGPALSKSGAILDDGFFSHDLRFAAGAGLRF